MKIISVTPAGRSPYINILANYLLRQKDIISEHHFWVNTDIENDIQTIKKWCDRYPKFFKFVEAKFAPPRIPQKINFFYSDYHDKNVIYLRFDDDICWIEKNCVKEIINFRINNPDFFLIYANTINHTTCNRFHQKNNCCPEEITNYFSGEDAAKIHEIFLKKLYSKKIYEYFHDDYIVKDYERVSVNLICWYGKDLNSIDSAFQENEEQYLSVEFPKKNRKYNCICGKALACHFAYGPQRNYLETKTKYLEHYCKISKNKLI